MGKRKRQKRKTMMKSARTTKRKVKRPTTWLNPKRKTKLVRKKVARMKRVTNRRLRIGQRKRRGKRRRKRQRRKNERGKRRKTKIERAKTIRKIRKGRSPETEAEIAIKK